MSQHTAAPAARHRENIPHGFTLLGGFDPELDVEAAEAARIVAVRWCGLTVEVEVSETRVTLVGDPPIPNHERRALFESVVASLEAASEAAEVEDVELMTDAERQALNARMAEWYCG